MAGSASYPKAYRIRFTPTKAQTKLLWRWFGAARFAYNFALDFISTAWRAHRERKTYVDAGKELTAMKRTEELGWLKEIPSDVLGQSLRNLDRAFANFFAKRARYPKRKKFGTVNTVRFALDPRHVVKMKHWAEGKLELPALGVLDLSRALPNTAPPKLVTVRLEPLRQVVGLVRGAGRDRASSGHYRRGRDRPRRLRRSRIRRARRSPTPDAWLGA